MKKTTKRKAAHGQTRMLTMTALLTALGYAATRVMMVPSPVGGYIHLGDTVVLLGAFLLGPVWGAVAGGIGPAMADLLAGYGIYVPGTLVIKAAMGFLTGCLYQVFGRKKWALLISGGAAEIVMVIGYWLYDGFFVVGSLRGSAAGIPGNLMQGIFGLTASTLLAVALRKSLYVRQEFPNL